MRHPLLCYFLPKNIISNLFELFFQQKNTAYSPVHHATSQRTRSLQLSPQSNAPQYPPPMLFLPKNIISNLFELFFSTKKPYTYHRVPHISPLLNRRHDNISGYTNIRLHKKRPTGMTPSNLAHQERNGIMHSGAGKSSQLISKWRAGIPNTKWLFGAFPFTHQCPP